MVKISAETVTKFRNMKIIQMNDYQNFTLDSVLLGDFVKINRKIKVNMINNFQLPYMAFS